MNIITAIRREQPLIHILSNSVTLNDVVNITLAAGATAICADAPEEVEEITALSQGLLLNTGTPSEERLSAMLLAGKKAASLGIPVTLDPAGAGSSQFRRQFLGKLLSEVPFAAIRANRSEMAALCGISFHSRGVEDAGADLPDEVLRNFASEHQCILAVTGAEDTIVSASRVLTIRGGTPMLKRITGSGCMLSALVAAAVAVSVPGRDRAACSDGTMENARYSDGTVRDRTGMDHFQAAADIVRSYGEAAVRAEQRSAGTASFRIALIDEISRIGASVP